MAAPTLNTDAVRVLQDRIDITDVLYRYASTIDRFDHAGLRSVLADDLWAQYGNADPVVGGDAVAAWIGEAIAPVVWQHHLLSVYHVEVDGDEARALVYHTSYQGFEGEPDKAKLLVGRYHNELRREDGRLEDQPARARDPVGRGQGGRRRLPRADRGPRARGCPARLSRSSSGTSTLRNRLVGTAHGRGIIADGLPLPEDAEYWRRRAAGGVAMLTVGGTVVAPESTWRRRITTEAWRPEAVPGMAARAEAIRAEGAVAACQLVHLGRETTGAEQWFHPVAPSAVRSPREPTRPRPLTAGETDAIVEGFRVSAVNAAAAGFQVIELHAAHGYLLAQFLSAETNRAASFEERLAIVARIVREIRSSAEVVVGIRLSMGGEGGLTPEVLPHVSALVDYVNLTVGERTTYVRDMATEEPPLLGDVERMRRAVEGPLLISHAFRTPDAIEAALAAGADLVGMARALIADPDMPRKLLGGRAADIRPCVACNEDCRAFDPVLLCSVNPELGPPGADRRPAAPLVVRRAAETAGRVAIVGAGPGGLECAFALAGRRDVVLFDEREAIGGQLAVAGAAPNRHGWRALLDFYAHALEGVELRLGSPVGADDLAGFDEVVLAIGSTEQLPAVPGIERALPSSDCDRSGPERAQPAGGRRRVRLVAVRERRRARRRAQGSRRSRSRRPAPPSEARCLPRAACSCSRDCAAPRSRCARSRRSTASARTPRS